jgi:hypothetical protein
MHQFDAGHGLQQFAGEMLRRTEADRRIGDGLRLGLGGGDQVARF